MCDYNRMLRYSIKNNNVQPEQKNVISDCTLYYTTNTSSTSDLPSIPKMQFAVIRHFRHRLGTSVQHPLHILQILLSEILH